MKRVIGVLAIQGDFAKHEAAFQSCCTTTKQIRRAEDLSGCDGLAIPGGESTTLTKLMNLYSMYKPIKEFAEKYPVMGTCAGMILIASKVDDSRVKPLELMDVHVSRNAYGRQIDSFTTSLNIDVLAPSDAFFTYFIRAPKVLKSGEKVKVLAKYNNEPVMIRNEGVLAMSFHPELGTDFRIHKYFLDSF